jgi:hypothetical protein
LFHPERVEPVAVVHIVVEVETRTCSLSEMIQIRVARVSTGLRSSLQVPDQFLLELASRPPAVKNSGTWDTTGYLRSVYKGYSLSQTGIPNYEISGLVKCK